MKEKEKEVIRSQGGGLPALHKLRRGVIQTGRPPAWLVPVLPCNPAPSHVALGSDHRQLGSYWLDLHSFPLKRSSLHGRVGLKEGRWDFSGVEQKEKPSQFISE